MIRVPLVDDALDEPPEETLVLTLVDPSGATLAAGSATGTIRDDDETPALSIEGAAGDEDVGELAFDVTLSAPSGRVVTVRYATFDGTAMSGDDFVPAKATLTLEPGVASAAIRVAIVDDIFDEPDETFVVGLADPLGASLATGSATGTIRDNDIAPPTANATMPDVRLCVGGADHRIDLAHHFSGEMLRFAALSSAPDIAAVTLADGLLAVRPVSEGEASVTLTAVNEAGEVSSMFIVHVVSDPAELVAVDGVLAGVGRSLLNTIAASIDARFELNRGSEPQPQRVPLDSASGAGRPRSEDFGFVPHNFPGTSGGSGPVRSDGLRAGTVGRRSMAPFSFSAAGSSPATSWSVWGRGGTHRFESPGDEMGHKGTREEVRAGIDARFGNWLAGVSMSGNRAVADYNFVRSLAGCGTSDAGTGIFETELMSVQPYAGRSMGSGWLWATVGAGRGEAVVERCGSGMRGAADLAMHTVAMGGRHPVAAGDRFEWSLVEDMGVLRLATDAARGPVGDREVTVGQARIGVQLGVAPARRSCPLTTWVRASARRDWGDGSTGVGVEFAAGSRYLDRGRRIALDAGIHVLATHSAGDVSEMGVDLSASLLPKADGTGLSLTLATRQGQGIRAMDRWDVWRQTERTAQSRWQTSLDLGYGFGSPRRVAMPFARLQTSGRDSIDYRSGLRYEFVKGNGRIAMELSVGQRRFSGVVAGDVLLRIDAGF